MRNGIKKGKTLSNDPQRPRALYALMESNTLTEAAARAGISQKTLYNYIHDDYEFSKAYKALRDEATIAALERLEAHEEQASAVIASILQDKKQPAAVRIKAAHEIIAAAARQREAVAGLADKHIQANSWDLFGMSH